MNTLLLALQSWRNLMQYRVFSNNSVQEIVQGNFLCLFKGSLHHAKWLSLGSWQQGCRNGTTKSSLRSLWSGFQLLYHGAPILSRLCKNLLPKFSEGHKSVREIHNTSIFWFRRGNLWAVELAVKDLSTNPSPVSLGRTSPWFWKQALCVTRT